LDALEKTLAGHGVSLRFSEQELDTLLGSEYGKRNTFSVLAAAYPALNTQFKFHLDHIYPRSGFDRRTLRRAGLSEEDVAEFIGKFNQLPNLQMLEGSANQSKLDTPFEEWIKPRQADAASWANYRDQHMIPSLPSYGVGAFKDFFTKRRALLLDKLRSELLTI